MPGTGDVSGSRGASAMCGTPVVLTHADEFAIDVPLVRRLIAGRFPRWAGFAIAKVPSAGTDNAMFRLGDDMVVRLPRVPDAARQVHKEQRWLPHLAPHLPLDVPLPVAVGTPTPEFPLPWSVYRWLDGADAYDAPVVDRADAARRLGAFVAALRTVDTAGGPPCFRGGPVGAKDTDVRTAIRALGRDGTVDPDVAGAAWESVLALPGWEGPPTWLHGDLLPGNLLVTGGRLTAVIDFGGAGVGDPACDMLPAWTVFTAASREVYREAVGVDDMTWARGRGWALYFGLVAEHHHRATNPVLAAVGRRTLAAALGDRTSGAPGAG